MEPSDDWHEELERRRPTANYNKSRAYEEFGPSVQWDKIASADVEGLGQLLDRGVGEHEIHRFFEGQPEFLVQVLSGGHGRWQLSKDRARFLSKPRLGAEYIPDFLIAEASSIGIEWRCVELKAPGKELQTQDGRETAAVREAIHQIRDWRKWLRDNGSYARAPSSESGLGLPEIDSRLPGLIIVGRRQEFDPKFNEFRRVMAYDENMLIHTYDWLLDRAVSNTSGQLDLELRHSKQGDITRVAFSGSSSPNRIDSRRASRGQLKPPDCQ